MSFLSLLLILRKKFVAEFATKLFLSELGAVMECCSSFYFENTPPPQKFLEPPQLVTNNLCARSKCLEKKL